MSSLNITQKGNSTIEDTSSPINTCSSSRLSPLHSNYYILLPWIAIISPCIGGEIPSFDSYFAGLKLCVARHVDAPPWTRSRWKVCTEIRPGAKPFKLLQQQPSNLDILWHVAMFFCDSAIKNKWYFSLTTSDIVHWKKETIILFYGQKQELRPWPGWWLFVVWSEFTKRSQHG